MVIHAARPSGGQQDVCHMPHDYSTGETVSVSIPGQHHLLFDSNLLGYPCAVCSRHRDIHFCFAV